MSDHALYIITGIGAIAGGVMVTYDLYRMRRRWRGQWDE